MPTYRPLSDALAQKAADELNENPADSDFYLDAMRQWIKRQPHLKSRLQDQFLISFLRCNKFSLEKTKQKLDNFYTLRGLMPELFKDRDVNDPMVRDVLLSGTITPLPEPVAEDGPRIVLIRGSCFNLQKLSMSDYFRVGTLMADILLYEDDHAIVVGYILVLDLANISAYTMFHFDATFIKKLTILMNKAMPSRMKGFHFINMMPSFEKAFNMVKGVINEKLRNRFYVHGNNLEGFYECVPKKILPVEYGGKCYTVRDISKYWLDKIQRSEDFFREEENFGVNEKLRVGKRVSSETFFGIEGSFRKLNVD